MSVFARLRLLNRLLNQRGGRLNPSEFICRKLQNRYRPSLKVLLVSQILIGCHEQVKFPLRQTKQLAILDATPTTLLYVTAFVMGHKSAHRPRNTLVKKNSHEVSSAASDCSKT